MGELVQQSEPKIVDPVVAQRKGNDGRSVPAAHGGAIEIGSGQVFENDKGDAEAGELVPNLRRRQKPKRGVAGGRSEETESYRGSGCLAGQAAWETSSARAAMKPLGRLADTSVVLHRWGGPAPSGLIARALFALVTLPIELIAASGAPI
jgi:hypothetical protein